MVDVLYLLYRIGFFDVGIFIVVLYYLSNEECRLCVMEELFRVVCRKGRVFFIVWVVE